MAVAYNMAMQRPSTRIVGKDLQHHISSSWQKLDISSLGVICVDSRRTIPSPDSDIQDKHIVAVQVDGMGSEPSSWTIIVDHDSDRRVGTKVLNVPFRLESVVASLRK